VVNRGEKILLLYHAQRQSAWEVINGALEREKTVLAGALRETSEQLGLNVHVRPLGTVHAYAFSYDQKVQYMISICYLFAYEGGPP
jgi:ADP-ribose pyrophosphatase YjhB (NUDIX family)